MNFLTRYKNLNTAQKQAVDTIDGPVMVIAGPGTGKTELLSMRVANILQKTDTPAESILCLTFTESGQQAMRQRLVEIIGKDAYKVAIHTFHSFGSDVIGQNREYFYRGALFEAADELKQYEILRGIFETLPPSNPLSSSMNGEYTHLPDAQKVISELKRASALTSDELLAVIAQSEAFLEAAEHILQPVFSAPRITKAIFNSLPQAVHELHAEAQEATPLYEVPPLAGVISDSLANVLAEAEASNGSTKPITTWKNAWLEKNEAGELVFKNRKRLAKLKALAYVYYEYLNQMEKQGLYDYDDMIMQVVHAVEVHPDLRFNLQEKYLYVMVDEFQDTNLAQLRILHALTDNPANEGAPNILVVGDDDQAIYGFQGADVSTILNFRKHYPNYTPIILTDNYRSLAPIIEASRAVIRNGEDRLETRFPELSKKLTAQRQTAPTSTAAPTGPAAQAALATPGPAVSLWEAPSATTERHEIVQSIANRIKNGTPPQSIAVLARRHSDIQSLLPYFTKEGIAVQYEKEESVLETAPVQLLETLARVVVALSEGRHDEVNTALPALLAHPAWNIPPEALWRLSLDAYTARQSWMEIMATTPQFTTIHRWLTLQAQAVPTTALEPLLDQLIGSTDTPRGHAAEAPGATNAPDTPDAADAPEQPGVSPFFSYFFSSEALHNDPECYISYLGALRAIRAKLREYHPNQALTLSDFLEFIDLHRRLGIGIMNQRATGAAHTAAVHLLTAHKAKGLEFDTVYVFNSVDSVWGHSARTPSRSIGYPENLPLAPAGNVADERLRLFYVAMTRARDTLVITYSTTSDAGKKTLAANLLFALTEPSGTPAPAPTPADTPAASPLATLRRIETPSLALEQESAQIDWYTPLIHAHNPQTPHTPAGSHGTGGLYDLLAPQLEAFKLSATALNNFLDVTRGGPQLFLLNNLLHFPKAKAPAASYGTAVHYTLQQAHTHLTATGEHKPLEDSLHDFEQALARERLSAQDHQFYLQKGSTDVPIFLTSGVLPMTPSQKAEVSFRWQDVRLGEARLTGSLDLLDADQSKHTITVTDYKTGRPATSWNRGDDHTKLKLHHYRQQLLFYKLLVEHATIYSGFSVTQGQLAFIEPTKGGESIVLPLDITASEDLTRTERLVRAVWTHIMALDFPDTSSYSADLAGVLAFEETLLGEV